MTDEDRDVERQRHPCAAGAGTGTIDREQPDVLCLQEIKASLDQLPVWLCDIEGYWCYWHGGKGYSGVALHVRQASSPDRPVFDHPEFDYEHRIVTARLPLPGIRPALTSLSRRSMSRTAGKTSRRRCASSNRLTRSPASFTRSRQTLVLCGDLNVALTDMDVHPKERKPNIIGQRPDERELMQRILSHGLVDVHRTFEPDNADLFTWWAPWRNMRQRNIGWRLDLVFGHRGHSRRRPCRVSCSESSARAITGR